MISILLIIAAMFAPIDDQKPKGGIAESVRLLRQSRQSNTSMSGVLDLVVREAEGNRLKILEDFGRIDKKIDKVGGRFDLVGKRIESLDQRQASRWSDWQAERTKRNAADEETKQQLADMQEAIADSKARIAESDPYRSFWRFANTLVLVGVGFLIFKQVVG